jgi:hypothetical protein
MDKEYVLYNLRERMAVLKERYRIYCQGKNTDGKEISYGTAGVYRNKVLRDLHLCMLVEELVTAVPGKTCLLSDDALDGLSKLMEPCERYERLRNA